MPEEKRNVFSKEITIVNHAKNVCSGEDTQFDKSEYRQLTKHYEELLNQTKLVTSVSDRLQNKLNTANNKLTQQAEEIQKINKSLETRNIELQQTLDALTKARVGRKAATIVIIFAVILFLVSEGVIEPIVEKNTNNPYLGFVFKGLIALLIKPIESLVEKQLLKRATIKKEKPVATFA